MQLEIRVLDAAGVAMSRAEAQAKPGDARPNLPLELLPDTLETPGEGPIGDPR